MASERLSRSTPSRILGADASWSRSAWSEGRCRMHSATLEVATLGLNHDHHQTLTRGQSPSSPVAKFVILLLVLAPILCVLVLIGEPTLSRDVAMVGLAATGAAPCMRSHP